MAKKMLIDATHPEETRVVVADGNKVDDFDFESLARRQLAGNIYLAKITRVEPSLQAAFVDYGGNRHGFLAFSEIHPDYYQIPVADREALLAEEEEAARNADRDEPEEAERKPRKPRRSRKQAAPAETSGDGETKEIAGLEVISVEDEEPAGTDPAPADTSAPESLNVVDAEEPGAPETPAEEVAAAAPAAEPEVETTDETPVAESSDGDVPEGDAPANDATPDDDTPPKTMAEDSGLDDESVSEDIQKPAEDAPEKPARKPRRRRKVAEPADVETAEAAAAEEVSTPDAPAQDASAADTPAADAPVADAPVGAAGSDTPAEAASSDQVEADASPAEPEEKTPRKRTRRPRRKKEAAPDDSTDTDGDSQTDGDTDGDSTKKADVESVGAEDLQEEVVRARSQRRRRYKIQDVVKVRQIMLVQVVKEERGNKGAALTTYLSLAGRYCVLMPNTARGGGISRKITQISDRKRLREIIDEQEVPKGMGLIVRTAGAERTRPEIKRDFEFLSRQWEQVRELTLKSIAPCLIYEEGSLIKRSIRDLYSKDIDAILVEGEDGYREAKDYMKMLMPSHAKNVQLYEAPIPLFVRYQAESYLNGMFSPTVQLKSGGYIVIGITEALVAVDVNSGRATKQGSIEETALQTNLEAADEVARQCRLRDLAGLIVIDFIDMDENRNNRAVEKRMKDRLKNDRARIQIGRISSFGLMEMSRQRLRPGMLEATTQLCPTCQGMGIVRSDENMALSILREVEEEAVRGRAKELVVTAPIDITNFLINHKRDHITGIETRSGVAITVLGSSDMTSPNFTVEKAKTPSREAPKRTAAISAGSVMSDVEAEEAELVEETDEQEVREPRSEGRAESRTDGRPESRSESRSDDNGEPREGRSRRRRGKRGGRRRRGGENDVEETGDHSTAEAQTETPTETQTDDAPSDAATTEADASAAGDGEANGQAEEPPKRKRQRRPRKKAGDEAPQTAEGEAAADEHAPADVSAQAATETVAEVASDPAIAQEPAAATEAEDIPAPTVDAPEPEAAPEVVAEAVAEPAPEPEAPPKPKRRGWWSLGG